jgi:hypothetical protein
MSGELDSYLRRSSTQRRPQTKSPTATRPRSTRRAARTCPVITGLAAGRPAISSGQSVGSTGRSAKSSGRSPLSVRLGMASYGAGSRSPKGSARRVTLNRRASQLSTWIRRRRRRKLIAIVGTLAARMFDPPVDFGQSDDEVLRLRMMADERQRRLFGVELEAFAHLHADAPGVEQVGDCRVVL